MRALIDEMNRISFAADLDDLMRSQLEQDENEAWVRSLPYSRGVIHVTSGELAEFFEEYIKLLNRYERSPEDTPPGARAILTRFMAFPAPAPPIAETAGHAGAVGPVGTGRRNIPVRRAEMNTAPGRRVPTGRPGEREASTAAPIGMALARPNLHGEESTSCPS